jgi:hypothetical protein
LASDENFSQLLSEARKYRLGLVLATQYAAQLRDQDSRRNALSAVLGNAGTVVVYRVGVEDAALLAPLFAPAISSADLMACPNFQGYIRLHLDGAATNPFSFDNLPDSSLPNPHVLKYLETRSRESWGVPASECESEAAERSRFIAGLEE